MPNKYYFYKENEKNKIWKVDILDENNEPLLGTLLFSFDKNKIYNLWTDYPYKFSDEEKELFDKEYPHWADFFKDRKKEES